MVEDPSIEKKAKKESASTKNKLEKRQTIKIKSPTTDKETPSKVGTQEKSSLSGSLFLIHLLIGLAVFSASLLIPNEYILPKLGLTICAPVSIMLCYFILARVKYRDGNSLNFADSIYYMGFIFTLIALLVSFLGPTFKEALGFSLESTSLLRSEQLLEAFGMALITTLFGLTVRTVIVQSQADPFEQINEFENDLRDYGQEATRQMQDVIVFFKDKAKKLRDSFAVENRKFIEEINAQTGQVHRDLTEEYLKIYNNMIGDLKTISRQAGELTDEQVDYKKDILSLRGKISDMEGNLSESLSGAFSGLEDLRKELESKVREITAAADKGAEAINKSVEPVASASESVADTASSMSDAAEEYLKIYNNMIGDLKTISRQAGELTGAFSGLEDLRKELESKVREITAAADKGAEAINKSVEPVASASEIMAGISDAAEVISHAAEVISHAAEVISQHKRDITAQKTSELEANIGRVKAIIGKLQHL